MIDAADRARATAEDRPMIDIRAVTKSFGSLVVLHDDGTPVDWPAALGDEGAYGRLVRVELLHWLRGERKYESLDALRSAIARDEADARAWLASDVRN